MTTTTLKPLTLDELKHLASTRWPEILSSLGGCPAEILDGRHHPCPLCGGTDRFSVFKDFAQTGGLLCRQCHDSKIDDGISSLQWLRGWTFKEALSELAGYLGVAVETKGKGKKSKPKDNSVFASPRDAVRHLLTVLSAGHPANQAAQFVRWWRYETFFVIRIDLPTPAGEKQRKTFRPLHPFKLSDGRWAWRFGYPKGKRPLYRKAALEAVDDTSLAVVVGGEKAADAAAKLFLAATTCAGGESAVGGTDWSPLARFDQVVVSVDNDTAGEEYGQRIHKQLKTVCQKEVKVVRFPDLPPKGDIVEWIAAGGTLAKFLKLAASEAAKPPDPLAADRKLCEELHIDVLGHIDNHKVKVFSEDRGCASVIDRIGVLSYADALLFFGPIVREKIVSRGDPPPGMHSLDKLKESIAALASTESAGDDDIRGQGVWRGDGDLIVLVGAGQAAVWDGQRLERICKPRVAGLKIDMDVPRDQHWYDFDRLAEYLGKAADRDWVDETITAAGNLFAKWYWRSTTKTAADLITALVVASWVQTLWSWRPLVSITGASDSGKSSFFELLDALFGSLTVFRSTSSEAGLRQEVEHHAKVILFDEFEANRHRKAILELLRTSSKGSKTARGTSGGHGAKVYGLKHIPWMAAVEIELARAPDRNRFIALELSAVPQEHRGKLQLPPELEIRDLGQRLLSLAMRHAVAADQRALRLKQREFEGVHGRVVESFSTPIAMLTTAGGLTDDQAVGFMRDLFGGLEQDPAQATKDETDLLGEILSSQFDLGPGRRMTVGQALVRSDESTEIWPALERVGIAPVANCGGRDAAASESYRAALFIDHKAAKRYLLRDSQWREQGISAILARLPGAKKCQQRVGGHRPWGVAIPWRLIKEKYLDDSESF